MRTTQSSLSALLLASVLLSPSLPHVAGSGQEKRRHVDEKLAQEPLGIVRKKLGVHETMKAIYTEAASRISVSFSNQHSPETNHSVCTPGGAGVFVPFS